MDEERLSGLAILSIENKNAYEINFHELINSFVEAKTGRVKL